MNLILKMPAPEGVLTLHADLATSYACEKESQAIAEALDLSTRMEKCHAESKKLPATQTSSTGQGGY